MKKIIKSLTIAAFLLIPIFMSAQSPFEKMFQKYSAKQGFTTVSVSNDMFHLFMSMGDEKDTNTVELRKVMSQLTGLKVITCDIDSTNPARALAFYTEATAAFPPPIYKELITVAGIGEISRFLTKSDAAGKIHEMVMLTKGIKQHIAMSITGNIDLATISRLSKAMDIKGMENLQQLKGKKK